VERKGEWEKEEQRRWRTGRITQPCWRTCRSFSDEGLVIQRAPGSYHAGGRVSAAAHGDSGVDGGVLKGVEDDGIS
jgi:hypothetical protein